MKHNAIVEGWARPSASPSDGGKHKSKSPIKSNCSKTPDQHHQLHDVVADLLLTNILSGRHAGLLVRAGEQSGARGVEALAKSGCVLATWPRTS